METIKGIAEINVQPLSDQLTRIELNSRQLGTFLNLHCRINLQDITSISLNGNSAAYHYEPLGLLSLDTDNLKAPPVHYFNRLKKSLASSLARRELSIEIPTNLIKKKERQHSDLIPKMNSDDLENETKKESFENILIRIEYELGGSHNGLQFLNTFSKTDPHMLSYFQITYAADIHLSRYWMPCFDNAFDTCCWDIEITVSTECIPIDLVDKLHAISSGVLYRQFAQSENNLKMFHFKLDAPMSADKISFALGLFESVKIPLAPFAHAFCPIGMVPKLNIQVEFFSKAFGFFNWYLSTLFPFASYYILFAKQLPQNSFHGANVSILSANLLYDSNIIDQALETRSYLAQSLCWQYFGIKLIVGNEEDKWLLTGIQNYFTAILLRVFHGKNDYKYKLKKNFERAFELEVGRPPLFFSHHSLASEAVEWFELKSHIVLVLLEKKLEKSGFQRIFMQLWSEVCEKKLPGGILTTRHFLKIVKRMTGKDMTTFAEQWIFGMGGPILSCSFLYNRKKSTIDLDLKQSTPGHSGKKFTGSLLIRVHEHDGIFDHSVHIDDFVHHFELPFHTKLRKARKKKNIQQAEKVDSEDSQDDIADEGMEDSKAAEEEDQEEDLNSSNSPISWIRLDPEMEWFCSTDVQQPDFMWMEQLENDRDVGAQHEAAIRLQRYASDAACDCFEKLANDWKVFYKCSIARLDYLGLKKLFELFVRRFGVEGPQYPLAKANNFENLCNYFIQCAFPLAVSTIVIEDDEVRLNQVLQFLIDLLRNNDNSYNTMSDNNYIANIIRAIGETLVRRSRVPLELLQSALEQFERFSKLERMVPYFRNNVMCAILETMSKLESIKLLPADKTLLQHMLDPGHYVEVRLEALKGLFRIASDDELVLVLQETLNLLLADRSRKFKLNAVKAIGDFSGIFAKNSDPVLKAELWNAASSTEEDVDWIQRLLALMQEIYPSASDDVVEIPQTVTLPGKKAGAVAPIKISLQVHDLGSSDEEAVVADGGDNVDWLVEMAGEGGGGEDWDGHKKKKNIASRPIPKLRLQPATSASAASSGPNHLESRMQESIQAIWDNYDSFPFRYPVDGSVPGYHLIIKNPMDLSTIQDKIRSHRYVVTAGLEPMIRDLRLMFDNCFTFNQPGSLIYDQAKRLRHFAYKHLKKAFPEYSKMIKGHLTASEPIIIVPEGLAAPPPVNVPKLVLSLPTTTTSEAAPKPTPVITLKAPAVEPVVVLSRPATPPPVPKRPSDKFLCKEILGKLKAHQHAYWFLEPIDPIKLGIPTYFEIIQEPMDFATISARLDASDDDYGKDAFKADVELVFKNAKLFNSPGTLVYIHAVELEKLFRRLWSRSFTAAAPPTTTVNVDIVSPSPPIKKIKLTQSPVKASPQPPAAPAAVKLKISIPSASRPHPDFEERCKVILTKCKSHEYAWPFLEPVDPVALGIPTYFSEIPHPMDLSTITKKLSKHAYGSHQEFAADFCLMTQNCIKFNGIDSDFAGLARGLQAFFDSLMAKAGLSS